MSIHEAEPGRLIPLAGILTPIGAVVLVRLIFAAGPAEAPAAPATFPIIPAAEAAPATPTDPPTPAQITAIDYLRGLTDGGAIHSPMARPSAPAEEPVTHAPPPPPPPNYDPSQDLSLSSVVGSAERGIASINGRIYRIGQEVVEGWVLTAVDARSRTAALTGPGGRTCVLEHLQHE